ncbi:hypothetical protein COL05_22945 [Bacillus sp. AFS059628]|nr:hypothetical protein COL05_22945 [Bacillus sp. AFS059628]
MTTSNADVPIEPVEPRIEIYFTIMILLYYETRQIPFSSDLTNIKMKYFGYVDFSQLWIRPLI